MSRLLYWLFEAVFVISALIVLKLWVFPFFIHLWFQEVLPIPDWTMLVFGVVTCVLYIGLGSTAKHIYGLPWIGAMIGFLSLHALMLLNLPFIKEAAGAWQGLLLDGISLFLPKQTLSPLFISLIYAGLFIVGRGVAVPEREQGGVKEKRFIRQKR